MRSRCAASCAASSTGVERRPGSLGRERRVRAPPPCRRPEQDQPGGEERVGFGLGNDGHQRAPNLAAGEPAGVDVEIALPGSETARQRRERAGHRPTVRRHECRVVASRGQQVEGPVVASGCDAKREGEEGWGRGGNTGVGAVRRRRAAVDV